ncbi:MAG: type VI secretion system baseplate subunit TssK [Chromatiales bacterium]|nr:type VI secretion system baseplate subunit TssK [Chromatiales bacterium]
MMRPDEAALKLGKIALTAGRGILPDGTPFDFPRVDEAPLPLDVPRRRQGGTRPTSPPRCAAPAATRPISPASDATGLTRYRVSELDALDNNTGAETSALVQVGNLRLRLMLKRDLTDAYACLGVVRITERRADNQVLLDAGYIAPTLSVRDCGSPGRLRARDPGTAAPARRGAGGAPVAAGPRRRGGDRRLPAAADGESLRAGVRPSRRSERAAPRAAVCHRACCWRATCAPSRARRAARRPTRTTTTTNRRSASRR